MTSQPVASPTVVLAPTSIVNNARLKYNKKVLTGLGIAEVVIGSLAIVFSCVLLGYVNDSYRYRFSSGYSYGYRYYYSRFNIGEGIWCGVWILVGGALGIASGRKQPTLCLINCHMGFSIVGAIFAAVLLSMGIVTALINQAPMSIGLESLLAIGGLVTFILCIVSAAYCCKLTSSAGLEGCCGPCCTEELTTPIGGGQVMYMTNPQSQLQAQQTIVQTYPTTNPGQQGSYPGNFVTVMQPGVAASNQPTMFAQQPVFVGQHQMLMGQQPANATQQPASGSQQQQTLTPSEPSQQSENERKRQEGMGSSANASSKADHGDFPPSYFYEN